MVLVANVTRDVTINESDKELSPWSVVVSGNLRLTFIFEGEDAFKVDLEDYH